MTIDELIKQTEERIAAVQAEAQLAANQAAQMALMPYNARLEELGKMLDQLKGITPTAPGDESGAG